MSRPLQIVAAGISLLLLVIVGVYVLQSEPEPEPVPEPEPIVEAPPPPPFSTTNVIGSSVEGRDIDVHTFGTGETKVLLVGGIHGGYEWNSTLLAYDFIDLFEAEQTLIPEDMTVAIVPNLNPDALFDIVGKEGRFAPSDALTDPELLAAARFNQNDVDLNRNFDCKWQPESTWRGNIVSAGTGPFSEPEAAALRDYIVDFEPEAVVFWHSKANTVYASECEDGVLPETLEIMDAYAAAADYNTQATFDAYPITGDAEGWLASIGIPAITVELETRTDTDWERNQRGVTALLNYYSTELTD